MEFDPRRFVGKRFEESIVSDLVDTLGPRKVAKYGKDYDGITDYSFYNDGLSFTIDNSGEVRTVMIYGDIEYTTGKIKCEFKKFKGNLFDGLTFDDTRMSVENLYGSPTVTGGGKVNPTLGEIFPFVKYLYPMYSVHFQFDKVSGKLAMITVSRQARKIGE